MEILILTALILIAIILFLIELFLIPGITIVGLAAIGCEAYAVYYAFTYLGATTGYLTLLISLIASIVAVAIFMRSKTLDKLSLKKNITSTVDKKAESRIKLGDTGLCTTRLALIGYAEINNTIVEVKSMDGFLDEKTPIIVRRISDGIILVEKNDK
jgi:membrane-bound ClpP family serine protease